MVMPLRDPQILNYVSTGMTTNLSWDCPKTVAFGLGHPHTGKGQALDGDGPADGTGVGKSWSLTSMTDEDRVHAPVVSQVSDRKRPSSASMLVMTPIWERRPARAHSPPGLCRGCTETPRPALMPISRVSASRASAGTRTPPWSTAVAAQHFEVLLGSNCIMAMALHAVAVGAHAGDILGDVNVHAADDGHNRNEGGGGQDDAEQREKASQFAPAGLMTAPFTASQNDACVFI